MSDDRERLYKQEKDLYEKRNELYKHRNELYEEEESHIVKILLDKGATTPTKKTIGAAAFDLYSPVDVNLAPGVTKIISLGFKVEIPEGYELKILPRSGLSSKGITVAIGTIDEDYRGEVGVIIKYEPEDLVHRLDKLYKSLSEFCTNVDVGQQAQLRTACAKLQNSVSVKTIEPYTINAGDRIAQIQLQKVVRFDFKKVNSLSSTDRGEKGYGSTGR